MCKCIVVRTAARTAKSRGPYHTTYYLILVPGKRIRLRVANCDSAAVNYSWGLHATFWVFGHTFVPMWVVLPSTWERSFAQK